MKLIIRYNIRKRELDYIPWPERGPAPPIVDPPEPDKPRDGEPPKPKRKPKPS